CLQYYSSPTWTF
nr:immunoglobulin light chain junction region [Macaca mulatta]MOW07856.1 immunoglobulin light chain junction region [Macaca mulatta]MOW07995.1 immunoglobulin light chain junction region [Macaca mulatta]MOW08093.1 immunoglobulin light chain junction region [Macaca mulatta]MOW08215.1 immunoglobulin light chain junction region [Macaca mulatta]